MRTERVHKEIFLFEGKPAVSVDTSVFQLEGKPSSRATRRIDAHYRLYERFLHAYARHRLGRRSQGFEGTDQTAADLHVDHRVTYAKGGLLSLYHDHTERVGDSRSPVTRTADTWRLKKGTPVSLRQLCGKKKDVRKLVRLLVGKAEQARAQQGVPYIVPLKQHLKRHFCEDQFYLTDEGLAIFWRPMTIAPPELGCPVILVGYDELGLQLPDDGETVLTSALAETPAKHGKLFPEGFGK